MQRDEEWIGRRMMELQAEGVRGRPPIRWDDCIQGHRKEKDLSGEEALKKESEKG